MLVGLLLMSLVSLQNNYISNVKATAPSTEMVGFAWLTNGTNMIVLVISNSTVSNVSINIEENDYVFENMSSDENETITWGVILNSTYDGEANITCLPSGNVYTVYIGNYNANTNTNENSNSNENTNTNNNNNTYNWLSTAGQNWTGAWWQWMIAIIAGILFVGLIVGIVQLAVKKHESRLNEEF